jgi:hypothetical protein
VTPLRPRHEVTVSSGHLASARARIRTLVLTATVVLAVSSLPVVANAHLGDLSYSEIVVLDAGVDYRLRFAAHLIPGADSTGARKVTRRDVVTREAEIVSWLARTLTISMGGRLCSPSLAESTGPDANDDLALILSYACPAPGAPVRIEFRPFDETLPAFQNIASVRYADRSTAFVFTAESRVLMLGEGGSAGGEAADMSFMRFVRLGVEHIWTGYDHLLFLLALLLPGGSIPRLAGIVTAFTIAHSVTLALAALDILTLPSAPVEAAIAASVVFAALDGLRRGGTDHRHLLTFAFGLVHGFGFAGILRAVGLPSGAVALSLLGFNLGVEAGQLAVVVAVVPLIRAATRRPRLAGLPRVLEWVIAAIGTFWLSVRLSDWLL